jgi:hypothetical protein
MEASIRRIENIYWLGSGVVPGASPIARFLPPINADKKVLVRSAFIGVHRRLK